MRSFGNDTQKYKTQNLHFQYIFTIILIEIHMCQLLLCSKSGSRMPSSGLMINYRTNSCMSVSSKQNQTKTFQWMAKQSQTFYNTGYTTDKTFLQQLQLCFSSITVSFYISHEKSRHWLTRIYLPLESMMFFFHTFIVLKHPQATTTLFFIKLNSICKPSTEM